MISIDLSAIEIRTEVCFYLPVDGFRGKNGDITTSADVVDDLHELAMASIVFRGRCS